jgi:hypothetical protein
MSTRQHKSRQTTQTDKFKEVRFTRCVYFNAGRKAMKYAVFITGPLHKLGVSSKYVLAWLKAGT